MITAEEIALQRHRWLSMEHVGSARPTLRAFVRKGHLERHYKKLPDDEVFAFVPGLLGPNDVWFGEWVADTPFVEVPSIKEAKGDQDYSQNGIEQVTLTVDNIAMIEKAGNLGALFHLIERGYYSPERGNRSDRGETAGIKNSWFNTWKDKCTQIIILAGYGDAVFPLHCGLVDKTNLTSQPDSIQVTIRSMGQFISDQDVFMDAKNLWVRDPITFADRVAVQEGENMANQAAAKNNKASAPPSQAVDGSFKSACVSAEFTDPSQFWWIEFPLPAGRYIKTELYPAYTNLEMFISILTSNEDVPGGGPARLENGQSLGAGWVDLGAGQIPGTGIPFVNRVPGLRESMTTFPITAAGQKIITGDGSKVRLWFRNLHPAPTDNGKQRCYRAGVIECRIRDVTIPDEAKRQHWILVDDASDIVRVVLQWCGFDSDEWEVENTGVRLSDKMTFDRTKKLMDIINWVKEQVGFVFYVRPPEEFDTAHLDTAHNLSMGVAVFRQSSATKDEPPETIESVRDDNLLEAVNAEFDTNELPDSIRVRGKAIADKMGADPAHVHALGADRDKRYQASYRPVWARNNASGGAHLRRPELNYDFLLDEVYLCEVACLLIAYKAALASAKGEIEIPAWPLIHLDHQTLLFDRGTGMSTRIWNVTRSWTYVGGEDVEFKMNLGGSFLDVDIVQQTREELVELLNERGRMPDPIARGPWTKPTTF